MANLSEFRASIVHLTRGFERNLQVIRQGEYSEASLRAEYIDKFFGALGWDIGNEHQAPLHLREVVVEMRTDIAGRAKRADYLFRVGGLPKFVVEAKRRLVGERQNFFQVQNYIANSGVWLGVLSDFEQLIVFVVGSKPNKEKPFPPVNGWRLHYKDYETKAEAIWNLFARDNVADGAIERFVQQVPKIQTLKIRQGWLIKPERNKVIDDAFLSYLEEQRNTLGRGLLRLNKNLTWTEESINDAVQKIIDRLLFQRICEDRQIDTHRPLEAIVGAWHSSGRIRDQLWPKLVNNFEDMRISFNGGLYARHFSDSLRVPEAWLADFLDELSDPNSNYQFSSIPVEILGAVYERFLGSRLDTKGNADLKPEVQKAGGVVYTPQYIVNAIVESLIGPLIKGKSPRDIQKLKIIDPACGSGSFLLRAFERICEEHVEWFYANPKRQNTNQCYKDSQGNIRLSTHFKREILINNIFGIDLDPQAVEVTQLSLYLKILEGETTTTLGSQRTLFPKETFLPDLSNNIKCGNALIAGDFGETNKDPDYLQKVRPFDWNKKDGFSEILGAGGFDVVIGNPPYVRIQHMHEWAPLEANYIRLHYSSAKSGTTDLFVPFIEKSLQILKKTGQIGMILSSKFLNSEYGKAIRSAIVESKALRKLVHFGSHQVFDGRSTYTCIIHLSREANASFEFERVRDLRKWAEKGESDKGSMSSNKIGSEPWVFLTTAETALFSKIGSRQITLGAIADVFVGVQTSADKIYLLEVLDELDDVYLVKSKALDEETKIEKRILFPVISGRHVSEYEIRRPEQVVLFPYRVVEGRANLMPFAQIQRDFPEAARYLKRNRQTLSNREGGAFDDSEWYRFGRSQNIGRQHVQKLVVPRLVQRLEVALDEQGGYVMDNVDVCGIVLNDKYEWLGYRYLAGILNSTIARWYFPLVSAPFQGGYLSANRQFISKVPIPIPNLGNKRHKQLYDGVVGEVSAMIVAKSKQSVAKTASEKRVLAQALDRGAAAIDEAVAELFELPTNLRDQAMSRTSVETSTG